MLLRPALNLGDPRTNFIGDSCPFYLASNPKLHSQQIKHILLNMAIISLPCHTRPDNLADSYLVNYGAKVNNDPHAFGLVSCEVIGIRKHNVYHAKIIFQLQF